MSAWLDVAGVAPAARLPCQACGTWTCSGCGWKRTGANLDYAGQDCPHCGSTEGAFARTRHYKNWTYEDHNPAAGPRCEGWYEYRPDLPCQHPSCRQVTWDGAWEDWEGVS